MPPELPRGERASAYPFPLHVVCVCVHPTCLITFPQLPLSLASVSLSPRYPQCLPSFPPLEAHPASLAMLARLPRRALAAEATGTAIVEFARNLEKRTRTHSCVDHPCCVDRFHGLLGRPFARRPFVQSFSAPRLETEGARLTLSLLPRGPGVKASLKSTMRFKHLCVTASRPGPLHRRVSPCSAV